MKTAGPHTPFIGQTPGSKSWYNMGLWSIKVYSIRGRDLDLSATMMGRRSSKRIEELLNAWVPDEMPPDWKP